MALPWKWFGRYAAEYSFFVSLLFASTAASPQQVNLRSCWPADLNTSFELINGPGDYFTAAFEMHNVSDRSCLLDRTSYGVNGSPTNPDRTDPWGKVFVLTRDSNARVWGVPWVPAEPGPTLAPNKLAYTTIRWKTRPQSETDPCVQTIAVNWPVKIVAPSLLKQLCSEIEVSPLFLGPFPSRINPGNDERQANRALTLTTDRSVYYDDEKFFLHLSFLGNESTRSSKANPLSTLYLRQRYSDGTTDFRSALRVPPAGCPLPFGNGGIVKRTPSSDFDAEDWKAGFDLDPNFCDSVIGLRRQGENTFEVFQSVVSPADDVVRFVQSNTVRIRFVDASAVQRDWGTPVKGIGLNVLLDKSTFALGEDVPLHLAVKNLDSDVPVYPAADSDNFCGVGIEVRDLAGQALQSGERTSEETAYGQMPSFLCPTNVSPYPKGKVVPFETTLGHEGWLPKKAGTYSVIVSLRLGLEPKAGLTPSGAHSTSDSYATIRAEVTVKIVDSESVRRLSILSSFPIH